MAGILASLLCLIGAYVYLCIWSVARTDLVAGLLAAVTYVPLMLIFVLFLPNLLLGALTGMVLGWIARLRGFVPNILAGIAIGIVITALIFRGLIPLIFEPSPGEQDFTSLITPLYFVIPYGAALGAITGRFLRTTRGPVDA